MIDFKNHVCYPASVEAPHYSFNFEIVFLKERDAVVAYCPALELSSCGRNIEEAQKMFTEAAQLFLQDCIKRNVLDEVLEECGWELGEDSEPKWIPPHHIIQSSKQIPVHV